MTTTAVAAPAAPAAKAEKKAKAEKAAKPEKKAGPSIRTRVFQLLLKGPVSGAEVVKALKLSGVPALLKDEGVCDVPRIKRQVMDGARGVGYVLTPKGKADLRAGKVDENAAPKSAGKPWPNDR